jgi:hypothetical protein
MNNFLNFGDETAQKRFAACFLEEARRERRLGELDHLV